MSTWRDWLGLTTRPPKPQQPLFAVPPEYAALMETTRVPIARVIVEAEEAHAVRASKLGGLPYRPVRGRYDELFHWRDDELRFIAQINCAELPGVPWFPREGVLQFWVLATPLHGLDHRDGSICLYYPSTELPQHDSWEPRYDDHTPLFEPQRDKHLRFVADTERMPGGDHQWELLLGDNPPFEPALRDWLRLHDRVDTSGHKVGGYCTFLHGDPRRAGEPMVPLLQLDSGEHMLWGDTGTGYWFLRERDLLARAFDQSLFHWEC